MSESSCLGREIVLCKVLESKGKNLDDSSAAFMKNLKNFK